MFITWLALFLSSFPRFANTCLLLGIALYLKEFIPGQKEYQLYNNLFYLADLKWFYKFQPLSPLIYLINDGNVKASSRYVLA